MLNKFSDTQVFLLWLALLPAIAGIFGPANGMSETDSNFFMGMCCGLALAFIESVWSGLYESKNRNRRK